MYKQQYNDIQCSFLVSFVAFEVLMGATLYKYNYQKQQRPNLNNALHLPFDQHVLRAGFYFECVAGGLFILSLLIFVLDAVTHRGENDHSHSVCPAHTGENS